MGNGPITPYNKEVYVVEANGSMGPPTIPIQTLPIRSIFDIISFAFHRVGRQWKLVCFLAIPIVLVCGFLQALTMDIGLDLPLLHKNSADWADVMHPNTASYYAHMVLSMLAIWLGAWFLNYLYLRAAMIDMTGGSLEQSFKQFLPDRTFWGYLGISLIQSLILLCTGGIAALGVLVLVAMMAVAVKVPLVIILVILLGIALFVALIAGFTLLWVRLFLCTSFYLLNPDAGILHAYRSAWQHSHTNWWRTLGFIIFLTLLLQMMLAPLFVIHGVVSMLTGSDLPGFKVIEPGMFRTVVLIAEQILWLSGTLVITQATTAYGKTRLVLDQIARRIQTGKAA